MSGCQALEWGGESRVDVTKAAAWATFVVNGAALCVDCGGGYVNTRDRIAQKHK